MLLLWRENGKSWAEVSRVRVSKRLWVPNTTEKESVQRATSERIVMMRVGLVIEDGIVRVRFSLPGGPRDERKETRRKKKGEKRGRVGICGRASLSNSTWLRLLRPIIQIELEHSGL